MSAAPLPADPVDRLLLPWWEHLQERLGPLRLIDAHTHIGANDPDGFSQTPEALLAQLAEIGARGVAFPMHEPDGYGPANDAAIAAARGSGGVLEAFCRVDPARDADGCRVEAERCLDAGARGIKLHPRAEGFTLHAPGIDGLFAVAAERRVPILIHAGRGIPALGADALRLARTHPRARVILAHAGICDLAWIWEEIEPGSNVFFDTAWWSPSDLVALFTLVPSSQILWASDSPYVPPLSSAVCHLRCALQAGLGPEALASVAGRQAARLLAGEEAVPLGRPPGERAPLDPVVERAYAHLVSAFGCSNGGGQPNEQIDLARLACRAGSGHPAAELLARLDELLGLLVADFLPVERGGHRFGELERLLVAALTLARTPAADRVQGR